MAGKQIGRLRKLPGQKNNEAERIKSETELVVNAASRLKAVLRRERSLEISAMLVIFRPLRGGTKPDRSSKNLDFGVISASMMRNISDMKRFIGAHPEFKSYVTKEEKVYMFPYGLPVSQEPK
jgi:hypothetical protein